MLREKRFLTTEEIEDICNTSIPEPIAFIQEVSQNLHSQIKNKIAIQLSEYKIFPEIIDDLKLEISKQFEKSIISPGEPIGLTTGEAIGQQLTQMNLNTFHSSGSSKIIETSSLRILLNATTLQNPITTVHFKNKSLTFDEVLNFEKELIEITVDKLLLKNEIINITEKSYTEEWWYKIYCKIKNIKIIDNKYFLRLYFNINLLYEYKITLAYIIDKCFNNFDDSIICVSSPTNIGIIDIYINNNHLITKSKCKINDLVLDDDNIESIFNDCIINTFTSKIISGISGYKSLTPITVKTWNIIKYEEFENNNIYNLYINFLTIINDGITYEKLEKLLNKCNFSIINKNLKSNPKKYTISPPLNFKDKLIENIKSEIEYNINLPKEISFDNLKIIFKNNYFYIEYDNIYINDFLIIKNKFKNTNVDFYKINIILKKYKLNALDLNNNFTLKDNWESLFFKEFFNKLFNSQNFSFKNNLISFTFDTIKKYIDILYFEEQQHYYTFIKSQKLLGINNPFFPYNIILDYNYNYAEILGIDLKELDNNYYPLKELLIHPDIDPKYTISNNIKEILKIFDIEVARNIITIFAFNIFKSNSSYINPRHFTFLSDYMTNSGVVIPITSKGISKLNRGVFADASFEQPVEFFIKSAFSGKIEKSDFTSTSIFMGKRISIGTGAFNIKINQKNLKLLDSLYNSSNINIDSIKEPIIEPDIDNNNTNSFFYTMKDDIFTIPSISQMDLPIYIEKIFKSENILNYKFSDPILNSKNYLISNSEIEDFLNFNP